MNRNITLIISLCFSLFFTKSKAAYIAGGEILYRNIGGLKYEITVKIYRDCQGASLDTVSAIMFSGNYIKRYLKLSKVSIKDISNYCNKTNNPCGKANTSNAGLGIEEHIYKDTVDFNSKTDSAFKQYCVIEFSASVCCRSGTITTGSANKNFWVYSSFDLCVQPTSNPIISSYPSFNICCNHNYYYNFGVFDSTNRDSFSYSYYFPCYDWGKKITYNSGYGYQSPISVYWPSGYDKSKGPKPEANPPIGIYLDPETADFIFTPTDCSEVTIVGILITIWRKNKKGTYKVISSIVRDMVYNVTSCPGNNPPILNGPYKYSVCGGDQICFTITSDDKQYVPPPPAKANPPDTLTVKWNNAIGRGSTFTNTNPGNRLPANKFCWKTKLSDFSDLPYSFTVTANDNFCPKSAITIKSYAVLVKQKAKAKINIKNIKNGKYEVECITDSSFKGSASYFMEVLDTALMNINNYYFSQTSSLYSIKQKDTIFFYNIGKYFLHTRINNPPYNCPTEYYDTISVNPIKPFLYVSPNTPKDSFVCRSSIVSIAPILKNAVYPVRYKWSTSSADTLPYINPKIVKDTVFRVDIYDSDSFHRWAIWKFHLFNEPSVNAGIDVTICKGDSINLTAKANNYTDTVFWKWYYKGKQISNNPKCKVVEPGIYTIEINDSNNCLKVYDSLLVSNQKVTVYAGSDQNKCPGDTFLFSASGLDTTNKKTGKYYWYNKTINDPPISTQNTVKFLSSKDGFLIVKLMQTQGKLTCSETDTVNYFYLKNPEVSLKDTSVCQNQQEINLMSLIKNPYYNEKGKISWFISSTLKNPKGNTIKTNDIIYNSDSGNLNKYFMKIGKDKIELGFKNSDFINLKFSYIDTLGCRSKISDSIKVTIRKNYEIEFTNPEIKICHGDSIKYISDAAGVNLYGGKWFTNNDSANYNKWYQGNNYPMSEKIKTNALDANGGKYLLKYIIENNNCVSEKNEILNIYAFPQISWSQTESGDSVIFYDNSKYSIGRIWMIKSKVIGKDKIVKISKSEAKSNTILLKVYNELMCEVDSVIKPIITWGVSGIRKNDKFKIYPNPAQNALFVKSIESKIFRYEIYNELSQKIAENKSTLEITEIDIKKLIPGIYSIVIFTEGKNFSGRFIKNQ